jgi:hypothetical protein
VAKVAVTPAQVAAYDRVIATHPDIERKGRNLLYTSVNGHMFSVFSTEGHLGIRLPRAEREAFLEAYGVTLLKSYGATMREYVTIPDDLLEDTARLAPVLAESYAYVSALPLQATKKPRASTSSPTRRR